MGEINTVGIVGSGIMGAGLAEVVARSGLRRRRPLAAAATAPTPCVAGVTANLDRQVAKGKLDAAERDAVARAASPPPTTSAGSPTATSSSRASSRTWPTKRELFAELEQIVKPDGILATNTSTLPVVELAMATQRPDRVCGIHFFNPAPMMKLVEVVRPLTASDDTIKTAMAFATACGKDAIEVADRAGFVVNALLFPYLNNAVRMLEHGTASPDDIDTAMQGGCNFPMGPLALLDLVGLDTSVSILDALYAEFRDPNYAAVPTLRRMVAAGHLGRKTKRGFYSTELDVASSIGRDPCGCRRRSAQTRSRPDRDVVTPVEPPPTRWRLPDPERPTTTASSASAPTSSRARCSPPTAAGCSRCRSGGAASPGSRPTRGRSSRSTGCASAARCAAACAASTSAATPASPR